ncbi:MAG TPA: alpha/beta hydrolase [Lysobacter sp.]
MNPTPSTATSSGSLKASAARSLEAARAWAGRAEQAAHSSLLSLLHCAVDAYRALDTDDAVQADAAKDLATQATAELLSRVLQRHPNGWSPGPLQVGDVSLHVEFREVSLQMRPPLRIRRAQDVSMDAFDGERHQRPGFGVPLAALSPPGEDAPLSRLQPRSGAFRNLTAWIEPADAPDALPRLVLADPQRIDAIAAGPHRLELARDTSAGYAWAMEDSRLERAGLWALLGGQQIGRRAGVYLLEDYDPDKRPLVMIHGLGSIPLIWAHLSNAVWGADDLHRRFQIWQVVYQTDEPLLVARARVQGYLDSAWQVLDPRGDAPARTGAVLVGHSLGGVVARLLCVDSGDALWNAAFAVPPGALDASDEDKAVVERIFSFRAYPGIARAVFMAAPHRGSPGAGTFAVWLTRSLIGRRTPEVHALRRIALSNPDAVRPELRQVFQQGWINSISTLQSEQPVRRATESLLPPQTLPYHTIAGVQPWLRNKTDGVVPLDSALIAGAASNLVIASGHRIHDNPLAVAEVLRILRER